MVFLISLHWTEQFYLLSTELRQNRADLPKTEWMKARLAHWPLLPRYLFHEYLVNESYLKIPISCIMNYRFIPAV